MEEKIKISILLNLYGNLLTDIQRKYMDMYYNQDLSLSEIAEIENITRQAVRTILLKSKKKLFEYEKKLNFMQKEQNIKTLLEQLKKINNNKEQLKLIEKIKDELDY